MLLVEGQSHIDNRHALIDTMPRNESVNSPLSRIAQEANRQKNGKDNRRISLISAVSVDSVSTTGRLLDKLKLADNEWEDSEKSSIASPIIDPDTSAGSVVTLNSENSVRVNTSTTSESTISSNNVLPASKFKYLKYVLGDTKKKNSQKSAVNKALEMGKKINTVEQNASRVMPRANVKSIHLDGLLRDADSSISSFDSQSEEEDNDYEEEEGENETVTAVAQAVEGESGAYGASTSQENLSVGSIHSRFKNTTPYSTELSFLPNTPTKPAVDQTPVNSPEVYMHTTPQYSMGSTPKMHLHTHHNHTLSSLSNGSVKVDAIHDSFIHRVDREKENDNSVIVNGQGKGREGLQFRQILPSHQHTNSVATTDLSKSGVDPDLAKVIDDSLMRSASVPIKRTKSVTEARTPAPKTPLPAPPVHLEKEEQYQPKLLTSSRSELIDEKKEHNVCNQQHQSPQARYYNNSGAYPFSGQYSNLHQIPSSSPHRNSPQFYQQSPQNFNGTNNPYSKRGINSPSSNPLHFVPNAQAYQHRNFNPQYGSYGPYPRNANYPKVSPAPSSQPGFYPQQQQQHAHGMYQSHSPHPQYSQYPNGSNSYYKNPQRLGYSPQTSPKLGYFNLSSGNHNTNSMSHALDLDGRNPPSTPPSHLKKNTQFRNVDLSHIVPR